MKYRKINNIFFVGIGGIGMSGIAELLYEQGFNVSGSDIYENENVKRLKKWSENKSELNSYQSKIIYNFLNIKKKGFGSASWTVVEPNCHFSK